MLRSFVAFAFVVACGSEPADEQRLQPLTEGEPPAECVMPTSVCSASVDTCATPVVAEDCDESVGVTTGTLMVSGAYENTYDPNDPDGWLTVGFKVDGSGNGRDRFANGVAHDDPGVGGAAVFTIAEAGTWVWSASFLAGTIADETPLEVEFLGKAGCEFVTIAACSTPADPNAAELNVAMPAIAFDAGDEIMVRARNVGGTLELVNGWIEGRRLD